MAPKTGFYTQTSLLFCITLISPTCAARVLGLFSADAKSHFNFNEAMMRSLLAAGHQVTTVAPMLSTFSHENYTIIIYKKRSEDSEHPWAFAPRQKLTSLSFLMPAMNVLESDCRDVIKYEKQMNITGNFDIMFVEMVPMFQCYLPLARRLGIPVIGTMAFRSFMSSDLLLGNPQFPSILPAMYLVVQTKMSFYERIVNVIEDVKMKIFQFIETRRIIKFFEEFFPDQDPLKPEISLLFVNNHESILPIAQTPNTINIGGIHLEYHQPQPLPEPLKKFIEEAKAGVILFSLGSVTTSDSFKPEVLAALIRGFARIPQRVVWKFSGRIDGLSKNVLLMDWLPQKEILAHENVKAFISHGGINSIYEAIYFNKPLVLMPIFSDQLGNTGLLMSLEVGKYLNLEKVTENELLETLNKVINGTTYRKNMEKLSKLFKDAPVSASEKVLFWTEYTLRHNGTAHLRSVTPDLPLYQYLLLDIFVFLIGAVMVFRFFFYFLKKIFQTQ